MREAPLLALEGYAAGYARAPVFKPLSADLNAGDVFAVTGQNGSGKSTLLRGVIGMAPIEKGRLVVKGRDLTGVVSWERVAFGIAYVSQAGGLFDHLSIEENLRLATGIARVQAASGAPVAELMGELAQRANTPVGKLSGGERRLVALARAFSTGARVFLLDEPLAGIASERRPELVAKVVSLVRQTGSCALWVEHKVPELAQRTSGELRIDPVD